jgi:hypothetical protein
MASVIMQLSIIGEHEITEKIKRLSLNVQFVSEERAKELVESFAEDSLTGDMHDFPQFIEEELQKKYEDWHICHHHCDAIKMTKLSDNEKVDDEKVDAVWDK